MSSTKHIAIIGNGWAGFTLAHALSMAKYEVSVIGPIRTVQYTPLLASAAAGMFDFRLAEEPVRRRNLLPGLRYYKANVEDVDFEKRELHCRPAVSDIATEALQMNPFTITYDKLVIAPGCDIQTFGTPGAKEYSNFLRTTDDARKIQQRLLEMLDAASTPGLSEETQKDLLRILVVGGGPIGIEATAEMFDLWSHDLRHLYPHLDGKLTLEIHDVAPQILGMFDERLGEYALEKLKSRGIKIVTRSHIEKVSAGAMTTKEQGEIPYGMLIWATGNGVNPLVDKLAVKKDGKLPRICTDRGLRVLRPDGSAMQHVYALGDAADIEGYSLPTLAEVAVQKAEFLARELNIGDEPAASFAYRQKANLAYLGARDGVIGGQEKWTGYSAWLAWRSGSILHWPRSWRRTVMIGISWLFNRIGGRDIARR